MASFSGKVALVTGGTQGMGLVSAVALAKAGATVVIAGRDVEKGKAAAAQASVEVGRPVHYLSVNTADPASVEQMIAQLLQNHGCLDLAFNNAGVTSPTAPMAEVSITDWQRVIDINVNGTFYSMKYEIAAMLKSGGGAIVNNSSVAGLVAVPNQASYVASKAAVIGLTRSAAIEYADSGDGSRPVIRVNAIAPGPILGGMNSPENLAKNPERTARKKAFAAMNRFGTPEEVAAAVVWLLSDASSYLTGTVIPIDGGALAGRRL
jgi:NAD(P)-dependent dehydrogenase (short-subunit alcohol dehydrogenase family)